MEMIFAVALWKLVLIVLVSFAIGFAVSEIGAKREYAKGFDDATEGVESRIDVAFSNGFDEGVASEKSKKEDVKRGWITVRKTDVKKPALKKYLTETTG